MAFGQAACPPPNCTLKCAAAESVAFEMTAHNSPVFRQLSDGTDVSMTDPVAAPGPKVNYSVTIGTLPGISLSVSTTRQFATLENGPSAPGKCFNIRASGFEDPKGTTDVTDAMGVHTINVNKPSFLCTEDNGVTMLCFQDKEEACSGGPCMPPGAERNEDVCAVATVIP
jgi:hypothetical protein